jgi:hypothetical protein
MGHDWIKDLTDRIKEIDHDSAKMPISDESKAELMRTKGLAFFNGAVASIERMVARLRSELRGDITEGSIDLEYRQPDLTLKLRRPAYPYFSASLTFEPENDRVRFTYSKANPTRISEREAIPSKDTSFLFLLGTHNVLHLVEAYSCKKFFSADELARHIVETLFSI